MVIAKSSQLRKMHAMLIGSFGNLKNDVLNMNSRIYQIELGMTNSGLSGLKEFMDKQEKTVDELRKEVIFLSEKISEMEQKASQVSDEPLKEGEVRISEVQFESPGDGKRDLNSEWVEIEGYNVDLAGCKLFDKSKKHSFKFPDGFVIYGKVKVYSGKGKNSSTELFLGSPRPIWNDEEDIATLVDKKGEVISMVRSARVHSFERIA